LPDEFDSHFPGIDGGGPLGPEVLTTVVVTLLGFPQSLHTDVHFVAAMSLSPFVFIGFIKLKRMLFALA
jgi:hypothetical protein